MHSSTSPSQKGWPPSSQRELAPISVTARRAGAEEGSRPNSRSCDSENDVAVHGWPTWCHSRASKSRGMKAPPAHCPSSSSQASSRAPQPSVPTLARSALHCASGTSSRSRSTCQRIDGSESSSQSITEPESAMPARLPTAGAGHEARLTAGGLAGGLLHQLGDPGLDVGGQLGQRVG